MKKVILLLVLFPYLASGQIVDDFESGIILNWIQGVEGHWKADTLQSISGNFSLHHVFDNSSGGSGCIGLPLTDLHPAEGTTRWTFQIRHGCDPSASNNWAVWIMSDHDPVSFADGTSVNGFAAGVNLTGYDDTLRLWKISKSSVSEIVTCPINWQNDIGIADAAIIIIERGIAGNWSITVSDNENNLKGTASGSDIELSNPAWIVLNYRYTSTRDRLLWLDDLKIEGVFYEDKIPPEITGCRVTSTNSLELTFNEEPSDGILLLSNISLNGGSNQPVSIMKKTPSEIEVRFENIFNNKAINYLKINQICDNYGNCSANIEIEFISAHAEPGDVIISEIMANPLPAVSLPGKEYLEIFNRTAFPFNLKNWSLGTESQKTSMPSANIDPSEYLILCSAADTSLFSKYGKVAGLKSFPALNDEGRMIYLSDSTGNLIHGLEYSPLWYGDNLKTGGGWSLEMIDAYFPFYTEGNWEASSSKKGGTPGSVNSASRNNPDIVFYGIENVFPEDSATINISLSETMIGLTGSFEKILINGNTAKSIVSSDPLQRKFIIHPKDPLIRELVYTLFLAGDIRDFSGNEITRRSFRFGLAETASKGNVVFNEILFNPFPEDPDYVEIYNCSGKVIDASRLFLASVSTETGDTSEVKLVSDEHRCIIPGSFYVVTTDRDKITDRYPGSCPENIFNAAALPSMPDDKGHLLLLNRELVLIDEIIYSDGMHYSLLADNEGVSLEKIRPEILSAESTNWHSASESSGWGTPGAENSVFSPSPAAGDRVNFSSGRISPYNDGYEDVLVIDLDPAGTGNIVTISVFDETGSYVRRIIENYLAGESASIVWDATADDGSLVDSGIYIILIELFDSKGKTKSWKKVCTVVR
jgi:hypothetical protein